MPRPRKHFMAKGQESNGLVFSGEYAKRGHGIFYCSHCGKNAEVRVSQVLKGSRTSCGCISRKNQLGYNSEDYERLYGVWKNMLSRCYNPSDDRYYTYGTLGVEVCDEWKSNFRAFAKWANDNGWKPELSIERNDLNMGYCPENCTFITMAEQARNKRNNIRLTINGESKCLTEWCEIFGVPFKRTHARYRKYGFTDPDILFYPGDLRHYKGRLGEVVCAK